MMGRLSFLIGLLFVSTLSFSAMGQTLSPRATLHEMLPNIPGSEGKATEAVAQLKVVSDRWIHGFLPVQLKFDHANYATFQTATVAFKDAREIDVVLAFNPVSVGANLSEIFFAGNILFKTQKENISGSCLVSTGVKGQWESANCFLNKKDYISFSFIK